MLANYLIGFREGLEAALIVGILVAYVIRVGRRDLLPGIWFGVGIAVALSFGFGAALTWGPYGLTFQAQETIGGVLSLIAVGFATWMVFWMGATARTLKGDLEGRMARAVQGAGWAIVLLAFLSVIREGLEASLFVWATVNSAADGWFPLIGALLGIATAVGLGVLLFRGVVRINLAVFFRWSGAFLILVAAGVLAYGIGELQNVGLLPGAGRIAYNIADVVPPTSWYGTVAQGIVNFNAAPTVLQVASWLLFVAVVGVLYARRQWPTRRAPSAAGTVRVDSQERTA